jgi:aminopeptidase C
MKWIYHVTKSWDAKGYAPAQQVLMRAIQEDAAGDLQASNIIELNVFAMEFYFNLAANPFKDSKYQKIFWEELEKKDYFLEELEISPQADFMFKRVALYLKCERFENSALQQWLVVCLQIWGFEQSAIEETSIMSFAETNPLLKLFSGDNAEKFEKLFGKPDNKK